MLLLHQNVYMNGDGTLDMCLLSLVYIQRHFNIANCSFVNFVFNLQHEGHASQISQLCSQSEVG